jgi:hypothetical protein
MNLLVCTCIYAQSGIGTHALKGADAHPHNHTDRGRKRWNKTTLKRGKRQITIILIFFP